MKIDDILKESSNYKIDRRINADWLQTGVDYMSIMNGIIKDLASYYNESEEWVKDLLENVYIHGWAEKTKINFVGDYERTQETINECFEEGGE